MVQHVGWKLWVLLVRLTTVTRYVTILEIFKEFAEDDQLKENPFLTATCSTTSFKDLQSFAEKLVFNSGGSPSVLSDYLHKFVEHFKAFSEEVVEAGQKQAMFMKTVLGQADGASELEQILTDIDRYNSDWANQIVHNLPPVGALWQEFLKKLQKLDTARFHEEFKTFAKITAAKMNKRQRTSLGDLQSLAEQLESNSDDTQLRGRFYRQCQAFNDLMAKELTSKANAERNIQNTFEEWTSASDQLRTTASIDVTWLTGIAEDIEILILNDDWASKFA
eukprot:gnl/TRDRNA2_/TRDRNA2_136061_c1_seq3.p1 gnl/TRDRNA2_/TRDRNA2_136061_c1~~gnl/TRDRNA2_/TRDRNA2_136061_c1_seq3.p1  ORF type:complete len:324 (-),score=46.14 gnl/TRDRNA2_/TRDRNA2_136061_c1_seq3:164-997(-)